MFLDETIGPKGQNMHQDYFCEFPFIVFGRIPASIRPPCLAGQDRLAPTTRGFLMLLQI